MENRWKLDDVRLFVGLDLKGKGGKRMRIR